MNEGWPKRWWSAALLAAVLTGIVMWDVRRAVGILTEPVVDRWELLGLCVGGTVFALLAMQSAVRAVSLRRTARAVSSETRVDD
ncbi:hypothetical protein OH738_19465 [Streptomyces hirsutus]|uniref:hypothetical protein n=1 Tax=Streptomyces hirsutus TaxID=35620 RepID=UPI003869CC4D|nr:hypothetical protein OH738_19465 [Streptomyces hirsutus]